MGNVSFSKLDLSGGPFVGLNPNGKDFREVYLDFTKENRGSKGVTSYPSHESYPSPWAPAEYFAFVLANIEDKGNLHPLEKQTVELLDTYLKGVFSGILLIREIDIDKEIPENSVREVLEGLFPFNNFQCKMAEEPAPDINPIKRRKMLVIEFNGKIVALEYPETIFFPAAYFSYWPDEAKGEEKRMIKIVEKGFNALKDDVKAHYYGFLKSLLKNVRNVPWQVALNIILKGEKLPDSLEYDHFHKKNICLKVDEGQFTQKPLYIYDPLKTEKAGESLVEFKGGSIIVKVGDFSEKIESGCKARDEKFYIIEELFEKITLPGGIIIDLDDIGKETIGDNHWTKDLRFKNAHLVVRKLSHSGEKVLGKIEVRLVSKDQVFVDKIVNVGGKFPDSALRKLFQRKEGDNESFGFEEVVNGKTYSILNGKVSKTYDTNSIVTIDESDKFVFAIWPKKLYEGWKPYFLYISQPKGVKVKLKLTNKDIGEDAIAQVLGSNKVEVKKISPEFLKEGFVTFLDLSENELGSFNIKNQIPEFERNNKIEGEGIVGVDFGTSSSVVAFKVKDKVEAEVLEMGVELAIVFGNKNTVDKDISLVYIPATPPLQKVKEVPSLIYKHDIRVENPFQGFEEGSIIYYLTKLTVNTDFKRIVSDIKWSGTTQEKELYLYLLLLMALAELYEREDFKSLEFYFSYPLSLSKNQKEDFENAVKEVIDSISNEIKGIEFKEVNFVSETDVLKLIRGEIRNTLVIDMGGGSTEITFLNNDGKPVYADSIKIAGDRLVEIIASWLDKNSLNSILNNGDLLNDIEIVKISIHNILRNPSSTKSLKLKDERKFMEDFSNFFIHLMGYIKRQIRGIMEAQEKSFISQEKIDACSELDREIVHIDNIILLGNAWKLFDYLNSNLIRKNSIDYKELITEYVLNKNESTVIIFEKEPKTWLAEKLAGDVYSTKFTQKEIQPGGFKTVLGISVKSSTSKKVLNWYESMPIELHNKGISDDEYFQITDNRECECIKLAPDYCNSSLMAVNDYITFIYLHPKKNQIIRSLLSYLIENYYEKRIYVHKK